MTFAYSHTARSRRLAALIIAALVVALLPMLAPAQARAAAPGYFTAIASAQSVEFGGHRYFFADDDRHGYELWRTNGTAAGTELFIDINPGDADSDAIRDITAHQFFATPTALYLFAAVCATEACSIARAYVKGIYRVDVGARKLVAVSTGTSYDVIANLGTKALVLPFLADRLSVFDAATGKVTELTGYRKFIWDSTHPDTAATVVKGVAYFPAEDPNFDQELWRTDGTQAGTYRVKNIRASSSSYPRGLVAGTQRLYFTADDGFAGAEIWTTDGTEKGTVRLTDHGTGTAGVQLSAHPPSMVTVGDRLYYQAFTTASGLELWTTTGTPASVKLVRDLAAGAKSAQITHMVRVGDRLGFFRPGTGGQDVWMSDGTSAGTVRVTAGAGLGTTPIQPAYYRTVGSEPAVVNGQLVYMRLQGLNHDIWQTGTKAGTSARIARHTGLSARPTQLLPVGTRLFYTVPTQERTFAPTHYLPRFASITPVVPKLTTTPTPKITGTALVGRTLKATAGTWKPAPVSLTYQWKRSGKPITGATKSTYKLVKADAGKKVTVTVTGKRSGFVTASKTSSSVTARAVLTKTPKPKIAGTATVGTKLRAVAGTWAPAKVTLKYQWLRSGKAISGATKSTYTLKVADRGKKISVKVTGSKSTYKSVSKTSAAKTVR